MSTEDPQPAVPPPTPPFQFTLRTLLLLFVVLGSSLAVFGAWGIVVFAAVVGLAVYLHEVESLPSLMQLILVLVCLMGLLSLLMPGIETARESSRRVTCANNLKQIEVALQVYHDANGCFPPAYTTDKTGKPMHSWRVLILPYLDEAPLYKAYDFTKPWDAPKNKKLLATRPKVYACPSDRNALSPVANQTSYVAVVGPNAAWAGGKPRKLKDFGGDVSKTIMLVEVANSGIDWAEPRDLSLDALGVSQDKSPALVPSSNHGRREGFFFTYDYRAGVNVAMADGSVRFLRIGNRSIDDLRKLLQIGGFKEEEIGDLVRRLNWPNIAALAVWLLSVGALLTQAVRSRKTLPTSPAR
jgi:prepilin-type processing-associated H-X9-DG protein